MYEKYDFDTYLKYVEKHIVPRSKDENDGWHRFVSIPSTSVVTKLERCGVLRRLDFGVRHDSPLSYDTVFRNEQKTAYKAEPIRKLTISDLEQTPEDRRVELIDGVFYDKELPILIHQRIVGEIYIQFRDYFENKGYNHVAYFAPVGVKPQADDDHTVVEPDVIVVCDPEKQNHPRYIIGGPDLVVEVLSPSTKKRDMTVKKLIYQEAGVREYWIVDPEAQYVFVYDFKCANVTHIYTFDEPVPVGIYDRDLVIHLVQFLSSDGGENV